MIKQGKNTIYCDDCKAEIPQTKDIIETKHLTGGIQINFFRCKKCNTKYLIDVTSKEVREKQIELRKWSEQHKKAMDIVLEGLSQEELDKLLKLADECLMNIDRLRNEIKSTMTELKEKYKGEL